MDTVPESSHPLVVALTAAVDRVAAVVAEGAAAGLGPSDAAELLVALVGQAGRLQVAAARWSTFVDDDGLWAIDGSRSFAHWLAGRTGTTFTQAKQTQTAGRALRDHLPATAASGLAGAIGAEQVRTMVQVAATSPTRCLALAAPAEQCGEEFLLAHAQTQSAAGFRNLARRWAAAADPACDERGYCEAIEREFLTLSATTGGYHLAGFLTIEHGALVDTALTAVMTPPAPDDPRTTPQRRAQGLADLARLALDHGLAATGARVRPHLTVVVDYGTLRRTLTHTPNTATGFGVGTDPGSSFRLAPIADVERFAVAEIIGAGPVPPSVLARLACDSQLNRVIFGPDSTVINVGRDRRLYSGSQRKAIIARDGTCRYPGCTAPPALCEIHHTIPWARDHGETDINTGILLCWHHHDVTHRHHIDIRPSGAGGWTFHAPHGTPTHIAC